jgi:ABC-type phosphate/phosphonate transport system substrate-binding protein
MIRALLLLILLALPGSILAAPPILLRGGWPIYAFSGVSHNDVEVSTSFHLKKLADDHGMSYTSRLYTSRAELTADMLSNKLDLVLLNPLDLMNPDINALFEPLLCPIRGDAVEQKLLLLVHRDSGIHSLQDLRGRKLLIFSGIDSGLEMAWLNRELTKAKIPSNAARHFGTIEYPTAAGQTIPPVFFKKADACIVSESIFSMLARLNPQVNQRLISLATSEPLLNAVVCLRKDYPVAQREILLNTALNLNKSADGHQILLLTRIDQVVPYNPQLFESSKKLLLLSAAATASEATTPPNGAPGHLPAAVPAPAPPDQTLTSRP